MSKKPKIVSAGGVVLREHTNGLQVLLIHRERYDDWSLPKGKGEADELLPETARSRRKQASRPGWGCGCRACVTRSANTPRRFTTGVPRCSRSVPADPTTRCRR